MRLFRRRTVGYGEVDASISFSLFGILNDIEESVTYLFGDLGIDGFVVAQKYNAAWVYVKNKTQLLNSMTWNDKYTVESYFVNKTSISVDVEVLIKNSAQEICAASIVQLVPIDKATGKIMRLSAVGIDDSDKYNLEEKISDIELSRFKPCDMEDVDKVVIKYTNLDFLQHTNNKEYIRFILDTYTSEELKSRPIKEIEVQYINQSFEGDELTISKGILEGKDVFAVSKGLDRIVKCEILR